MKLVDLKVIDFIQEIDSKQPAPGGGSVAALNAVMGVSLARMVGHLTFEKKKFLALESSIQLEFKDTHDELLMIKNQLILAIDQDTDAFNQIMAAFKLPKESEEEIKVRKQKIQDATLNAIMVPLKVATLSMSALNHLDLIIVYGNQQTLSDLGVAILNLTSAVEGACMNVLINLPGLTDQIAAKQYKNQVNDLLHKVKTKKQSLLDSIETKLQS